MNGVGLPLWGLGFKVEGLGFGALGVRVSDWCLEVTFGVTVGFVGKLWCFGSV